VGRGGPPGCVGVVLMKFITLHRVFGHADGIEVPVSQVLALCQHPSYTEVCLGGFERQHVISVMEKVVEIKRLIEDTEIEIGRKVDPDPPIRSQYSDHLQLRREVEELANVCRNEDERLEQQIDALGNTVARIGSLELRDRCAKLERRQAELLALVIDNSEGVLVGRGTRLRNEWTQEDAQ
jgi:hypothetical protein